MDCGVQLSEGVSHLVGALRSDRGPSGSDRRPVNREVAGPEHRSVRPGLDRLDDSQAELVVKVKELQVIERVSIRSDHVLSAYLHLAPDED